MIWEYLAGELSVLLEELQAAADAPAGDLARLRHQVEDGPATELDAELAQALATADRLCWDSLARGDIDAFARQAPVCADLRMFGACARLIDDGDQPGGPALLGLAECLDLRFLLRG